MVITSRLPLILKSITLGIVAAIVAGGLALAASPLFDAVAIYIAPAAPLLPVIAWLIPSRVFNWLTPDGGAPAFVFLMLVTAICFWTIVFGFVHFAWASYRRKRVAEQTATADPPPPG